MITGYLVWIAVFLGLVGLTQVYEDDAPTRTFLWRVIALYIVGSFLLLIIG